MIIGINGRINSGKDTVGKIIQILCHLNQLNIPYSYSAYKYNLENNFSKGEVYGNGFIIKKFAGKLKQIVSLLTGCSLDDLENQDFKDKYLPREWQDDFDSKPKTYRWMLQTIGTESLRNIIHENVHINGLFADYKSHNKYHNGLNDNKETLVEPIFPSWIITDCRFPNELEAVKSHQGITIKINRKKEDQFYYLAEYCNLEQLKETIHGATGEYPLTEYCKNYLVKEHESETSLDNSKFDYEIDNNGTIEELVEKVKQVLISAKII